MEAPISRQIDRWGPPDRVLAAATEKLSVPTSEAALVELLWDGATVAVLSPVTALESV